MPCVFLQPCNGCLNGWQSFGEVKHIGTHLALVPVKLNVRGLDLRRNDPLPIAGFRSRDMAVEGLKKLAESLNVKLPDLGTYLPHRTFQGGGELLREARRATVTVTRTAYCRTVDQGPGLIWGFCHRFVWQTVQEFLQKEGYIPRGMSEAQYSACIGKRLADRKWATSPLAKAGIFYLMAKAKSLAKKDWLWRPIAATPEPFICPRLMRIASRAMTCFIRTILDKLPAPIFRLSVNDLGGWLHDIPWAVTLGEADCKEQFNKIAPQGIIECMEEASKWLMKRRRWGAEDLIWSVHRECSKMDRAGKAAAQSFHFVSHQKLMDSIRFDLTEQNSVYAVGKMWTRAGCIPTGGCFPAPVADLHSVWRLKRAVRSLRQLGDLSISDPGMPVWDMRVRARQPINVTLAQFRGSVLVASSSRARGGYVVSKVCETLSVAWEAACFVRTRGSVHGRRHAEQHHCGGSLYPLNPI
mmetsp:Transcript_95376/g.164591  ORF Transcript_95376/g.164591 Transcript_95376/m.164591 type:complete len:468 (-) Transcript_95376:63-1466(-)